MEVTLKKETLRLWQRVFKGTLQQEETMEAVVPDSLPDAAELLDADASICLRSKETEDGAVTATVLVQGTVLCRSEEKEIFPVQMSSSADLRWEDAAIAREDQVQLRFQLISAEARTVNPRKLLLRCGIAAEAEVFREEVREYAVGTEGENIQQRRRTETVSVISSVTEKTFIISEELPLNDDDLPESILLSRVQSAVEDVREVAGKAVLQGKLSLELLYTSAEDGAARFKTYAVPFSQIVDAPEDAVVSRFSLLPTAVYAEILPGGFGGGGFSLEAHMAAQAVFCSEYELAFLSDAYSTVCPEEIETEELTASAPGREQSRRVTLRDTVELREEPSRVLWSYMSGLQCVREAAAVKLTSHAHVFYLNGEGALSCAHAQLREDLGEAVGDGELFFLPVECYASPAGRGIEVRFGAELRCREESAVTLRPVSAVRLLEEQPYALLSRPSLSAVRRSGRDIWALAKKYLSTPELIESANPDFGEMGGFLLIPRFR